MKEHVTLDVKVSSYNISLINFYAPTLESEDKFKDIFYDNLGDVVSELTFITTKYVET